MSCRICRGELSHGPPMRLHPRCGGIFIERGCNGKWRALRAGEGTAERWHGVCVPGIGCGYNSPSPPTYHLRRAGWLVPNLRIPYIGMRLLGSPTYLSCYRFYGHFVGDSPSAQKHVVNRWSLCRIAPRFRLVKCGGRCPQSLRVPRVLVCSSRQLNRQPAPRRPLPRRGYKENTKKTAFRAVCVWFWGCFLVVDNVFLDTEKHRGLMRVKKIAVRCGLNRNGTKSAPI